MEPLTVLAEGPCWAPRLSKCISVSAPGAECMCPLCCPEGGFWGSFSPGLAGDSAGAQGVVSLQMGSLLPERGRASSTITQESSKARIMAVLSVVVLPMTQDAGACSGVPHPGPLCGKGLEAAAQAPAYFVCNYLARKPRSCYEQVSADKPMSLRRDHCS